MPLIYYDEDSPVTARNSLPSPDIFLYRPLAPDSDICHARLEFLASPAVTIPAGFESLLMDNLGALRPIHISLTPNLPLSRSDDLLHAVYKARNTGTIRVRLMGPSQLVRNPSGSREFWALRINQSDIRDMASTICGFLGLIEPEAHVSLAARSPRIDEPPLTQIDLGEVEVSSVLVRLGPQLKVIQL